MFGCPLQWELTCLNSCLKVNSFAASPVLQTQLWHEGGMGELLHLRHAIMQSCIRMGCASCFSQESLFNQSMVRSSCETFWCSRSSSSVYMFCYCSHVVQGTGSSQGRLVPHGLDVRVWTMMKTVCKQLICYSACWGWSPAKGPAFRKPCLIPSWDSRVSVTIRPAQIACFASERGWWMLFHNWSV